jgi:hypothetical protein
VTSRNHRARAVEEGGGRNTSVTPIAEFLSPLGFSFDLGVEGFRGDHGVRMSKSCPTGFPQEEWDPERDLLDLPPFFPEEYAPRSPRSPDRVTDERPTTGQALQVNTKAGVVLPESPYLRPALEIAAHRGDVVTSGRDGSHLPNSLHYAGLAIDVRPAVDLRAQVQRYRSAGFSVLTEGLTDPETGVVTKLTKNYGTGAHLHISFDPEGRRV